MLFKKDYVRRLKHLEKIRAFNNDSSMDREIERVKYLIEQTPEESPELIEEIRAKRRERAERKAARRLEWAKSRESKAHQAGEQARRMADVIPFGQPILVGHYSENADRRYRARITSKLGAEQENLKMAEYHRQKAQNIVRFGIRVKGDAEREREERRQEQGALITVGAEVADFCFGHGVVTRVNKKTYTIRFDSGATFPRDKVYVKFLK